MNVQQLTVIVEALTHSVPRCSHYHSARERHGQALKYANDMLAAVTNSAKDVPDDSTIDEAFHDVFAHRQAWRDILVNARQKTESPSSQTYYEHELRVFDRTFSALGQMQETLAKHLSRMDDLAATFNVSGTWDDIVNGIKARQIDPEKYFVVEFIEKREDGPYVTRVANMEWPDWADTVNPSGREQFDSLADEKWCSPLAKIADAYGITGTWQQIADAVIAARQPVGQVPAAFMVRWKVEGGFGLEWPKDMQYFRDRADEYEIVPLQIAAPPAQGIDLGQLKAEVHGRNPLLAYVDSYRLMANMGDGRVSCSDVAYDIEKNMAPHAAPPAQVIDLGQFRNAVKFWRRERARMAACNNTYIPEMESSPADDVKEADRLLALIDGRDAGVGGG